MGELKATFFGGVEHKITAMHAKEKRKPVFYLFLFFKGVLEGIVE